MDPRKEFKAALQELNPASFEWKESRRWWSAGQARNAERTEQSLKKVLEHIEHVDDQHGFFSEIQGEVVLLEALFHDIRLANQKNERMREYVRSWEKDIPPDFLVERLKHLRKMLQDLIRNPELVTATDRRAFLGLAAKVVAGLATAGSVADAFASGGKDREWWRPGVLYLQLGAFRETQNAGRIGKKYPDLDIRYYPQKHVVKTKEEDEEQYWYHVIVDRPCANIEEATRFLYEQAIDVKEAGIIGFYEDGRTLWVKTVEERVIDEIEKTVEEVSTIVEPTRPSGKYPFHSWVVEAVKRYPLTGKLAWDASLIHGVKKVESNNNPNAGSGKGAKGLMQMMPGMFNTFHFWSLLYHPVNWNLKAHLCRHESRPENAKAHTCHLIYDPEQNIDTGTHQLYYLFEKYYKKKADGSVDLNAVKLILRYYNGGETKVRKGKLDHDKENLSYPGKVLGQQARYAP